MAVPDVALRTVVEDSLGLAEGSPIPATELAELTVLDARYKGIVHLTGVEHATGLRRLILVGNSISRLAPLSGLTGLNVLSLYGNEISDLSPLAGLTAVYVDQDVDLTPCPGRPRRTSRIPPPYKYPQLGGLSRIVESYEAALEAGRVTNRVGGEPCLLDEDGYVLDFSDWDPSKPAPSILVVVIVEYEAVELVTVLLEDHGIRYYVSYYRVEACVPVPLLGPLSELPGVRRIELVETSLPDSPTLLEGISWGAVKVRFK